MTDLVLGAVAGVAASALFSAGLVLQSLEARRMPRDATGRLGLVRRLLRRPRWVFGGIAMLAGFGFHVSALLLAPLTVVQPSLAAGLLVLLIAGTRTEHAPVGSREIAGVLALAVGLVALTLTAPERTTVSAGAAALALALGGLGAVALLPTLRAATPPGHRSASGRLAAFGAGAAYALTGITTKLVSDRLAEGDWAGTVLWLAATGIGAGLAVVDQTAALHDRPATEVGVFLYVMPVVVPVVLAPVLVGEAWSSSPGGGAPLALALGVVCAGAAALGGSRSVSHAT